MRGQIDVKPGLSMVELILGWSKMVFWGEGAKNTSNTSNTSNGKGLRGFWGQF